jgi:hypothetical protein
MKDNHLKNTMRDGASYYHICCAVLYSSTIEGHTFNLRYSIHIITPTQRRPRNSSVQVACLLQLANPLLIHFVVGPTNTLCDQYLTWQLLRCSSASQVDGKVCQRYQGYFDANVRVGFLVYRLLEHPILSIPIPCGEIRQASSRNMESRRRWDTRFCTRHSSFWSHHLVVYERNTHSHLRPDCSPLPSPHS